MILYFREACELTPGHTARQSQGCSPDAVTAGPFSAPALRASPQVANALMDAPRAGPVEAWSARKGGRCQSQAHLPSPLPVETVAGSLQCSEARGLTCELA